MTNVVMKAKRLGEWDLQYAPRGWAFSFVGRARTRPLLPQLRGGVYTGTKRGFRNAGPLLTWDELNAILDRYARINAR